MPTDIAENSSADAADVSPSGPHLLWQWQAPAGPAPDSYNLYKGMGPGAELPYRQGLTGLSYSDPEATPGSAYWGYVTAVYAGAEAGPSNEASVTVPAAPTPVTPMSETHLFSTGVLTAAYAPPWTAQRGLAGAVATPQTQPLSALSDGNPATTASLENEASGSNTNYQYLVLDLGVPRLITGLTLGNVTLPGAGHSVLVTASAVLSLTGVPAGTVLPTSPAGPLAGQTVTASAPASTQSPANPAGGVLARYLYVQDTNAGSPSGSLLTVGEIRVQAVVVFATLQDVTFGAGFTRKDLFDAAQISTVAVDTADHEGRWTIKAGSASVSASALQVLVASALATAPDARAASGAASVNTLSGKVRFPALSATLSLQDTAGRPVTVVCTQVKAQGDQIAFKLTDFAVQNFELHAYPDPINNLVAVVTFGN